MSGRPPPLGELQQRAAGLGSSSGLRRLASELEADRRRGARSLAQRCRRRAGNLDREERRMARLLELRATLMAQGARVVAGVDEVGVGPLAGPVVAAAVVLPEHPDLPGLDDSKRVPAPARERLAEAIHAQALHVGVGVVDVAEVDRVNVYHAALAAMRRAVEGLAAPPDHVLVDARTIPGIAAQQTPLVGGDGKDASIAAASIVAKVHRDALMVALDRRYPGYGFASHKGYGTAAHLAALRRLGPCPVHRRSFAPVSQLRLL
jgi:ribonuclease HII